LARVYEHGERFGGFGAVEKLSSQRRLPRSGKEIGVEVKVILFPGYSYSRVSHEGSDEQGRERWINLIPTYAVSAGGAE